jgi:hypothetical protein
VPPPRGSTSPKNANSLTDRTGQVACSKPQSMCQASGRTQGPGSGRENRIWAPDRGRCQPPAPKITSKASLTDWLSTSGLNAGLRLRPCQFRTGEPARLAGSPGRSRPGVRRDATLPPAWPPPAPQRTRPGGGRRRWPRSAIGYRPFAWPQSADAVTSAPPNNGPGRTNPEDPSEHDPGRGASCYGRQASRPGNRHEYQRARRMPHYGAPRTVTLTC